MQQHQRIRDERERGERQRPAEDVGRLLGELAVGEQRVGDRLAEGREEHDDRDQRDHGQARAHRQIADDGPVVAVGGVARQSRHDCRQQGDADDAVGHLEQQPCLLVHRRRGGVGGRGDAGGDDVADLRDGHVRHDGDAHAAELLQAVVDAPQRAQVDAGLAQRRDHDQRLDDHAQRGAQPEQQDVRVGDGARVIVRQASRQQPVEQERRDGHHVVGHRRPGPRFEHPLGVQYRHEQRKYAVEDDLRQQQERERGGEGRVDLAVREVDVGEPRGRGDGDERDEECASGGDGDQASDEPQTSVVILPGCARKQRHEHAREHGTKDELGDHVRQLVRRVERRGDGAAEGPQDEAHPDEAGDAGDEVGDRHRAGGAQQAL